MPSVGPLELVVTFVALAVYVVPIALVAALIRGRRTRAADPLDTLRHRLARGDIDEAEYLRLRTVLRTR